MKDLHGSSVDIYRKLRDKDYRKSLRENPNQVLSEEGKRLGMRVEILTSEKNLVYVTIPNNDGRITSKYLKSINAGSDPVETKTLSVSTAGSVSTVTSSLGSASSAGSVTHIKINI